MGFMNGLFGRGTGHGPTGFRIAAPISGTVVELANVSDAVFSSKAMGDGVAIVPGEGSLVSPVDGVVEALFPTGHALGIRCGEAAVMLHIGIDTVNLNGEGFTPLVSQGDEVKAGQPLVSFDLGMLSEKGYDPTLMVVVTEPPAGSMSTCPAGEVSTGEDLIWFE